MRWWIFDEVIVLPDIEVPPAGDRRWEAHYENDCEARKRTTRSSVPEVDPIRAKLRDCEEEWSDLLGYRVEDDPTLHGGGLHVMEPGGWLNTHLDYDRHPILTDRRRALNLILFLHPTWEPGWGGEFYLADPLGRPVVTIDPLPGRLIAFEVGDLSYHGVMPVTGPAERVSLAVYYLSPATAASTRKKALFLPRRAS